MALSCQGHFRLVKVLRGEVPGRRRYPGLVPKERDCALHVAGGEGLEGVLHIAGGERLDGLRDALAAVLGGRVLVQVVEDNGVVLSDGDFFARPSWSKLMSSSLPSRRLLVAALCPGVTSTRDSQLNIFPVNVTNHGGAVCAS